ncbi:MAG: BrnT family toxin [Terriglobia bacterium]
MSDRQFQFEWDEGKAAANIRKHGVSFELASSVFVDPRLLSVADLEHSEAEERWFSVGCAVNGAIVSVVYIWQEMAKAITKIRLISARRATRSEIRFYEENL